MTELMKVNNLEVKAKKNGNSVTIIDNISFDLKVGETLGIVGESGCGKSVASLSILGLLDKNISITGGRIDFKDKVLTDMNTSELRKVCGKEIGMIFQEPMTALNPLLTIGTQLSESMRINLKLSKGESHRRSIKLLRDVGIKNSEDVLKTYPHELSGGMRQRVLIAIAISCEPQMIIADEPTTALDVTVQLQVLKILKKLIKKRGMSLLLISHDLGVISQMSERVAVMYSGEIVEEDSVGNIINRPEHPYTKKLLESARELFYGQEDLSILKGSVPRPGEVITGCKFFERCEERSDICKIENPPEKPKLDENGRIKCWNNKF